MYQFSRVGKCRGYGGFIRVNFLETWGKFFENNIRAYDAAEMIHENGLFLG